MNPKATSNITPTLIHARLSFIQNELSVKRQQRLPFENNTCWEPCMT